MAYSPIDDPALYFNTKNYSGNSSTQTISGIGFQPDWTWIKHKNGATAHMLFDSIRGALYRIQSNSGNSETSAANTLTAWNSDGFALGNENDVNQSGRTYVAWNWKAGTAFTNDASSTGIGSIDSSGTVNNDSGFSIVTYAGNGTAGATIKHGLNSTPKMILIRNRDRGSSNWLVYQTSMSANGDYTLFLDSTSAKDNSQNYWGDTAPTSSVFSVGNRQENNQSGENIIAYCFAEKQGYSKFGSYVGNGNANGTFVYTGQKSAFIMLKNTTRAASWLMFDNKRLGYNVDNNEVVANTSAAEETYDQLDFLSNGFKMRTNGTSINLNGDTYIYMCFADNPFTTSTGVPATAK